MCNKNMAVRQPDGLYRFNQPLSKNQIIEFALSIQYRALKDMKQISSPRDSKEYFQLRLANNCNEVFSVLFLSAKHRVIDCIDMFEGTIDSCTIYTRKVVEEVLRLNASAVIVAHNHPSGDSTPSPSDENITRHLSTALGSISVTLLDHIIVGDGQTVSLSENCPLLFQSLISG